MLKKNTGPKEAIATVILLQEDVQEETEAPSLPLLPLNVLALAAGFVAACQHAVCADVHKEPKSC